MPKEFVFGIAIVAATLCWFAMTTRGCLIRQQELTCQQERAYMTDPNVPDAVKVLMASQRGCRQ